MKNFNQITHHALRFAASASLALAAIASTAYAQLPQIVNVSETVTLRSGTDAAGLPLPEGTDDANITQTPVANCTPDPMHDYNDALAGPPAKVVERHPNWAFPLSDADARWIHASHEPTAALGSGYPAMSVQYAHPFALPTNMPPDASVLIELEFAADDLVGAIGFSDMSSIPVTSANLLSGFPTGNFSSITNLTFSGPAQSFGLSGGTNALFFKGCDTGDHVSGVIYSVKVTVEYCVVELTLQSGVAALPDDALVDVILLADSTGSMGDEIAQVQTDATTILNDLMSGTQDVQVGIADYKDFPADPATPYAFQLSQPITGNVGAITSAINGWSAAGGGDHPEGQLYALDRLADVSNVAGWRAGSARIIVYFGDAPGHDPICTALTGLPSDITETSVIAKLNNNGPYGTNVIAVSSGTGLNNPFDSDVSYTPHCGASTGSSGQAGRITGATGGLVEVIGNSSAISGAITSAINAVLSQPLPLAIGSTDPDVKCELLPNGSAFNNLMSGLGNPAFSISPNSAWLPSLSSGNAGWIHATHLSHPSVNGSGRPPSSVLYAHEFSLPAIPSNALVSVDLEWAADETLFGVSMNGDVASLGGNLGIGGSLAAEFSYASTAQHLGTAGSLSMGQGLNRLFLATRENYPGGGTVHNPYVCSGIMYNAKLVIAFNCESEEVAYESFCDCLGEDVSPCGNSASPGEGCANSTGAGSVLSASGPSSSAVTLRAQNLPLPQTIGLFFRGSTSVGPLPFGDGLRCVGGDVERIKVVITNTGEAVHGPIVSPTGSYYQFWYRDVLGPCGFGFNLSNAIVTTN